MIRIRFKNGAEGPEMLLDEKYETLAEAESQLAHLTHTYGTVPDAVAWIDGDEQPEPVAIEEHDLDATAPDDPADDDVDLTGTIEEVLARVDGDAEAAARVLDAESTVEKPRKGLVESLQKLIDDATAPDDPAE